MIAVAALVASLWFAPGALAHTHVRFGISIGAGNCWNCGYWSAPPVYYTPAYPPPLYYYPQTVYYAPRPAYYGDGYYGYYAPHRYYPGHYDRYRGRHYDRGDWHHRRGHYYHGHR